ncbi:phage tail assembly chaperone, partial [Klebsiella pneumoniae]|uniref:phage tail assembly chaperone n=1 Tax=Klebsiella pneumoniae TaxID=573 RepID=UPI003970D021
MEFEIKGVNYRTAKLDVFQQLKVSRKLLPVLAGLVSEFSTLKAQAAAGNLLWSSFFGHADQMVGLCTGGQLGGRA